VAATPLGPSGGSPTLDRLLTAIGGVAGLNAVVMGYRHLAGSDLAGGPATARARAEAAAVRIAEIAEGLGIGAEERAALDGVAGSDDMVERMAAAQGFLTPIDPGGIDATAAADLGIPPRIGDAARLLAHLGAVDAVSSLAGGLGIEPDLLTEHLAERSSSPPIHSRPAMAPRPTVDAE